MKYTKEEILSKSRPHPVETGRLPGPRFRPCAMMPSSIILHPSASIPAMSSRLCSIWRAVLRCAAWSASLLGAMDTASKCFEAKTAVENGAEEVDMVINIGRLKNKEYDAVREDIAAVKRAVGDKVLKVIIEACLLTDEEKEKMCDIVVEAGADFIKTSTGFSTAGATFHDIELFARCVRGRCKIKAAGGISTVEDMEKFLDLGADRLGTSRAVKTAIRN